MNDNDKLLILSLCNSSPMEDPADWRRIIGNIVGDTLEHLEDDGLDYVKARQAAVAALLQVAADIGVNDIGLDQYDYEYEAEWAHSLSLGCTEFGERAKAAMGQAVIDCGLIEEERPVLRVVK